MSIIDKAKDTVDSDRQSQYGDPVENAVRQALVASAMEGFSVSPLQCNTINFAQKVVRMGIKSKEDTMVDVAGYTEIRARLIEAHQNGDIQRFVEDLLQEWIDFDVHGVPLTKMEREYLIQRLPPRFAGIEMSSLEKKLLCRPIEDGELTSTGL